MYSMGADIAQGMAFLSEIKIVHRDLAARNCLVNDDWAVKIGDFGLTRDVYAGEYYRMTGSNPLPVRWMAPEAISDGIYTSEAKRRGTFVQHFKRPSFKPPTAYSDIWAFGIVMWEIVTFAKMPYAGMSNMEVVDRVCEDDYRLPCPKGEGRKGGREANHTPLFSLLQNARSSSTTLWFSAGRRMPRRERRSPSCTSS